jgi:drug/metabolite transporter (DMT)-like permease
MVLENTDFLQTTPSTLFTSAAANCFVTAKARVRRSLHKNLIGSIEVECIPSLVIRCVQGALSVFISFLCLKYFSVSIVGIVCSLTPLMVCLLAYFVLGEK